MALSRDMSRNSIIKKKCTISNSLGTSDVVKLYNSYSTINYVSSFLEYIGSNPT